MIWWVHNQLKRVSQIEEVYVATDDLELKMFVTNLIKTVMTLNSHITHLDRLFEVSTKVNADFYVNVNGDEPLIEVDAINKIIPKDVDPNTLFVSNLMKELTNPLEAVDFS